MRDNPSAEYRKIGLSITGPRVQALLKAGLMLAVAAGASLLLNAPLIFLLAFTAFLAGAVTQAQRNHVEPARPGLSLGKVQAAEDRISLVRLVSGLSGGGLGLMNVPNDLAPLAPLVSNVGVMATSAIAHAAYGVWAFECGRGIATAFQHKPLQL